MMTDFDAYEYLERTVENPELEEAKETVKSAGENRRSEEKSRGRSSKWRSEERDDDGHRSRRTKSDDESRDYDRHREKGSSRHRSRSRDGERDRHKSSRELKEKDGDKERSRGKEERNSRDGDEERHIDRDRDRRERDREIEKEKEKEKERDRSRRSSSRSERHRSDLDERDRERSRELKEREREREVRERDRESRRLKEKKEDVAEPVADPERDQRTVFAYQLSLRASERDVYEFFSRAGKVRDVRLIMDRNTRRSKGVGYVEFYDVMSVPMAIALSGQPLRGQSVMVKPSEAEKNLVQSTSSAAGGSNGQVGSAAARKLYVGNLHVNITENQLREVFEPFGNVELVQLPLDETGHCKGFGFVQFARLEDARNALNLNGQLEIGNRIIKVSTVTDHAGTQDAGPTTGDLDDDEGGGLSLNSQSRALLMAKLDRSGSASSIAGSVGTPVVNGGSLAVPTVPMFGSTTAVPSLLPSTTAIAGLPGAGLQLAGNIPAIDTIGVQSECLLLKNMFDPKLETEPDFDLDIKEDVQEECSKYGKLKHVYVDRDSAGFVYLRFENAQAAAEAQRNLHGRWFAGKMITATYMVPQMYEQKFPDSNR